MRIIFFNVWGGKIFSGVADFIKEQSAMTDVFCFQEANHDVKALCKEIIPDYQEVAAHKDEVGHKFGFSSATYVGREASITDSAIVLENQKDTGLGIYTKVSVGGRSVHICNIHGVAQPGEKLDNPIRIRQSQGLIDFFKDKDGLKIIGGDFNILPETQSIMTFQENGYKDIIKDFGVVTTRNRLAWERYPVKLYYSDYVFTSQDVKVKGFLVPNLEISDHLPLILDIEL